MLLRVDDGQFNRGYAPLACGLQAALAGCLFFSLLAGIWYFLLRGG